MAWNRLRIQSYVTSKELLVWKQSCIIQRYTKLQPTRHARQQGRPVSSAVSALQLERPGSRAALTVRLPLAPKLLWLPRQKDLPSGKSVPVERPLGSKATPALTTSPSGQQGRPGSKAAQAAKPPWQQGRPGSKAALVARPRRQQGRPGSKAVPSRSFHFSARG